MNYFFVIIYGFTGAIIGSFLNVCILRIPEGVNFVTGRSRCPSCDHTLSMADMVPVFSWVFLKGRCRYCGGRISLQYPAVELMTCLAFILCLAAKGPGVQSGILCLYSSVLITAAFIDARHMYIPDGIHLLILILSVLSMAMGKEPGIPDRLAGTLLCGGVLLLTSIFTHGGVGRGDVKLLASSGMLLGLKASAASILAGYVLAGLWYIIPLLRKKVSGKTPVPMAPFFAAALFTCGLWRQEIFRWYIGLIF